MMGKLPMWVVYDHPTDYPDGFIARLWLNDQPQQITVKGKTLTEVRQGLPPELIPMARSPGDDPCIVEVWL